LLNKTPLKAINNPEIQTESTFGSEAKSQLGEGCKPVEEVSSKTATTIKINAVTGIVAKAIG
ncbi:MAG: hypothetical protein P8O05_10970, partial [Flavobacteriales bacterium]|nr:hypothetical protein [Flavobacteriales bacterium]